MKPFRAVKIFLNTESGKIESVEDPDLLAFWEIGANDFPFGEHFGWNSSKYAEPDVKLDIDKLVNSNTFANAQTSSINDSKSHSTGALRSPDSFIMLDVGFWGQMKGTQRNFGLIENYNVWLCDFVFSEGGVDTVNISEVIDETLSTLKDCNCPIARRLLRKLMTDVSGCQCGIRLMKHAPISDNYMTLKHLSAIRNKLFIVLPDIHLPEKWPDYPNHDDRYRENETKEYYSDEMYRSDLRSFLHKCQLDPNREGDFNEDLNNAINDVKETWLSIFQTDEVKIIDKIIDDRYSKVKKRLKAKSMERQEEIGILQDYLDMLEDNPHLKDHDFWTDHHPDNCECIYNFKCKFGNYIPITAKQLLAEKNILDRSMMSHGCWFYKGAEDDLWKGDPQPAIDLANFLCAIRRLLDDDSNDGEISVIQVGDMLELWMNREFLYRNCDVTNYEIVSQLYLDGIRYVGTGYYKDDYQYRRDKNWHHGDTADNFVRARHYTFDAWEKGIRYRLSTKNKGKSDIERMKKSLNERIRNIDEFCLEIPSKRNSFKRLRTELDGLGIDFDEQYVRKDETNGMDWENAFGKKEAFWNRLVVDLFRKVEFVPIYGNHDGYRADKDLISGVERKYKKYTCESKYRDDVSKAGWYYKDGIWFEHCHRWDNYNIDGAAIGAAITNYTFYTDVLTGGTITKLKEIIVPQVQQAFMPGAAFWRALVNHPEEHKPITGWDNGVPENIDKIGVYVIGHTHNPDLYVLEYTTKEFEDYKRKEKHEEMIHRYAERGKVITEDLKNIIEEAKKNAADAIVEYYKKKYEQGEEISQELTDAYHEAMKELNSTIDYIEKTASDIRENFESAINEFCIDVDEAVRRMYPISP